MLAHGASHRVLISIQTYIPCRYSVAPPQLPADAPVPDALQPPTEADRCLVIRGCSIAWLDKKYVYGLICAHEVHI